MIRLTTNTKIHLIYLSLGLLALLIGGAQYSYDEAAPPFTTRHVVKAKSVLPEKAVKYLSFGFTNLLVDYYWISATQDFTGWNYKDTFYINYFKNIAALDPQFEYPYLFAIFAIPQTTEDLDLIRPISEKGIQEIPTSWKIPLYLGTKYYLFTKSNSPAEEYLRIAASVPGAPEGIYIFYSSFIARTITGSKVALNLLKVVYDTTDNQTIKSIAERGLQEAFIRQMIERGIAAYYAKFKTYPTKLEDLIKNNLVLLPNEFTDNFKIIVNRYDGSFRVTKK